jgi:dinuclear metal center YbgI/SA1388 family protein
MTFVREIVASMDLWAPQGLAYDWDRVGLQVGSPNDKVAHVLTCLTPGPLALQAAIEAGAQMVVAHHPLIFKPLPHMRSDHPVVRLCLNYHKAGIAVFAAHTNLDVVPGGVSHVLAERLGIEQCRPLFPIPQGNLIKLVIFVPDANLDAVREAVCAAGAGGLGRYTQCSFSAPGEGTFLPGEGTSPHVGSIGTLHRETERRLELLVPKARLHGVLAAMRAAHPYEEPAFDIIPIENADEDVGLGVRGVLPGDGMKLDDFAAHVRDALGCGSLRVVRSKERHIRTVAVLGGSGGGDIAKVPHDVDCYVTGDVKYHDADLARERGLPVIDAGHVATELPIVPVMARYLAERHPSLATSAFLEADPFTLLEQ